MLNKYVSTPIGRPGFTGIRLRLLIFCFIGILPAAYATDSKPDILAVVNGDTLFTSDLDSALVRMHVGTDMRNREDFDYHKLLTKLVNDRLLIQEATTLGMDDEEGITRVVEEAKKNRAIRRFAAENFKPDLAIADEEILDYFKATFGKRQVRTISAITKEYTQQLRDLVAQGAKMDSIATDTSLDTQRFKGGLHNLKYYGDLELEFRHFSETLRPGELSPVFPYRKVFAFLRLEKKLDADTAELAARRAKITAVLKQQKRDAAWKLFVKDLIRQFAPVIDSSRLAAIQNDGASLFTQNFTKGTDDAVIRFSDGRTVSDDDLRTTISHMAMEAGDQPFDTLLRRALDFSQEELALTAAASQKGYETDPVVLAAGKRSLDSALIEVYLKETVVSRITFSRQEFEDYYNAHPDSFRNADQFAVDQMILADSTAAQQILQRLAEGADFAYLARGQAKEYKAANLSEKNDWFPLFTLPPAIAADVAQAKVGGVTRAFPVTEGWIVFRLAGKRQGDLKPLADVEMKIREVMFQRKFDQALDAALNLLKANSEITYNDPAIKKYFGND